MWKLKTDVTARLSNETIVSNAMYMCMQTTEKSLVSLHLHHIGPIETEIKLTSLHVYPMVSNEITGSVKPLPVFISLRPEAGDQSRTLLVLY